MRHDKEEDVKEASVMMEPPRRRRRGTLQRIFDILRNAREPIKHSHLFHATNTTNRTLDRYLSLLLERELIEKVPHVWQKGFAKGMRIDKRTLHLYVVTDKGRVLIEFFERIYDILGWSEK